MKGIYDMDDRQRLESKISENWHNWERLYSETVGPRSCRMGRICIAEKRGSWLDLHIQEQQEKRQKTDSRHDSLHAVFKIVILKPTAVHIQPCISGVRCDSLRARLQPLSQEWNAGCSFVCSLSIHMTVNKVKFGHKWENQ